MPDAGELWGFAALSGAGMLIYVISGGPLGLAFAAAFIVGASVIWERIRWILPGLAVVVLWALGLSLVTLARMP